MSPGHERLSAALRLAGLVLDTARGAVIPGDPGYLIFFVTHRCNARCDFCFDRVNQGPAGEGRPELTLAEIERIASNWRGLIQVTLTGGEPFLRDDLGAIALAFARSGARSLTLASNGMLTSPIAATVEDVLVQAPGVFLDLDLSVDGDEPDHDRLRGVAGAYSKVMETAQLLAPFQDRWPGFRLGATVCVNAFNQAGAVATVRRLAATGLFRRLQAVWVRGRPFDPEALAADFSVYEECARFLAEQRLARGPGLVREALSARVREVVAATVREQRLIVPCRAGRTMVTLDPFGDVYPCEMLGQTSPEGDPGRGINSWTLGSLREAGYSIREVMRSGPAQKIREWIADTGCYCTFECAAYNNLVFSPRQWPALAVKAARRFGAGRK